MKKVFICYSQVNIKGKERLEKHLSFFAKQGQLEFWSDDQIKCGDEWNPEIIKAINESCAAILLISADFLISDYIQDRELPLIFQKRQEDGMKVFPFILYDCNWQEHKTIPKINARPKSGKPLFSFRTKNDKEKALKDFAYEIRNIINNELSTDISSKEVEINQVNNKLPLIDKIQSLIERFKPLSILKQNSIPDLYPFNENRNPKYSHFINRYTFKVANDEIAKSLKHWNDELLNNSTSQIQEIFSFLRNNLITNISGPRIKEFKINSTKTECPCLLCTFENLDLKLLDERINSNNKDYLKSDSIQNQLENAYINYRILNLTDSYNQTKQILDSVKNEENKDKRIITEFICKSNLQNLYWLFRNTKFTKDSQKILKELSEINLYNYLFDENIDEQVRTQLEYISTGKFIKSISYKIDKSLIEIRKNVDVNRNVQYHIDELTYHIAYIYYFIKKNYLFYDLFDDFKVVAEKSIDGIFAAFSVQMNIPKIQWPNLMLGSYMKIKINDFILNLCIFHCETDTLIRIFKRYKIENIPDESKKLIIKAINLCKSPELFDKYRIGNDYRYLYRNFESVFENLLFLISTCEDSPKIKLLFSTVVNLLEQTKNKFTLRGFKHFLANKRSFIDYSDLIKLFHIVIKNYKHDEDLFIILTDIHRDIYPEQLIGDSTLTDQISKSGSIESLSHIWFIANTKIRLSIQQTLIKSLQSCFDYTNYIDYALNKIIPYQDFLLNALEYLQNSKYKGLYEKVGNKYMTDDYNSFNHFIQLFYFFNIELPTQFIEEYEGYSTYHKFLLNPEEFDYSNFNVEWLSVYQCKSYRDKFKKVKKLKITVKKELNKNFTKELAEVYHKYLN